MLFVSIKFSLEKDSVVFSAFVNYLTIIRRRRRELSVNIHRDEVEVNIHR